MNNDDGFDPPRPFVQAVQGPSIGSSPRISKENHPIMTQPPSFSPPNMPTPALAGSHGPRAPEPMTLQERHQSALRQIHALQAQNAQLYDDNCRLVTTINMLNDRLAFFGAPQNLQVQHYTDVQQKLRTSEESRALLNRKYQELLQCIPEGSAQHHLSAELRSLQDAYTSVDKEYRFLREKYVRLKSLVDPSRVAQQHPQASPLGAVRGPVPTARPEHTQPWIVHPPFPAPNQSPNISTSPTSAIAHRFGDRREHQRRRSSESFVAQSSLRSGPTPIATSWVTPLPTPPPSAPLPTNHLPQVGFPVHASVPAGSLRPLHHAQAGYDPHHAPSLPFVPESRPPMVPSVPEQLKAAITLRQRCSEIVNPASNLPIPISPQFPVLASSGASPRKQKRSSSECTSPEGERKKLRIEETTTQEAGAHVVAPPVSKMPSPSESEEPPNDRKSSVSSAEVKSEEECVNIIFEQDAEIASGVFCSLCYDRYQAEVIPEPPDVLIQPEFNLLVTHCMTMHPAVWEELRYKVSNSS